MCLFADWGVLDEYFNSLCNKLPYNYHLTLDKVKAIPQPLQDDRKQLSKLISSSANVKEINEKIITYLIIKLSYKGGSTDLVTLHNLVDEMIDSTDIPIPYTCVQQIQYGIYVYTNINTYICI